MNIKIENKVLNIDNIFDMQLQHNKKYDAVFNDDVDCIVSINKYGLFKKKNNFQIRFSDDLGKEKKIEIKNLLINKYGEPLYFASDRGFVWKTSNYYISFGYNEINYNYAVLMIVIQKDFFNIEKIKYNYYKNVSDVFYKYGLFDDIILPWTRYSGFMVYKKYQTTAFLITYKKRYLNIYKNNLEIMDDGMYKAVPHSHMKKKVKSIDMLDKELEKIISNNLEWL